MKALPLLILASICVIGFNLRLLAQETVFNVPSADVLDKGKVYGEFDLASFPSSSSFGFTPRIVAGVGHHVEIGANFLGASEPATGAYILSPTVKWKFYDGGNNGWALFAGENLFIPVRKRTYNLGGYSYLAVAKQLNGKTRVSAGAYDFSANVVDRAQRAGGQFSIERKLTENVVLAADWFTGKHSAGYFTPGFSWTVRKFVAYAAYQIGNSRVNEGNHGPLIEFGYNF